eukprot:1403822-Prymnesium_polylepis.4
MTPEPPALCSDPPKPEAPPPFPGLVAAVRKTATPPGSIGDEGDITGEGGGGLLGGALHRMPIMRGLTPSRLKEKRRTFSPTSNVKRVSGPTGVVVSSLASSLTCARSMCSPAAWISTSRTVCGMARCTPTR